MKVHQTLEWLNLLSLGTKGLKPHQQSVYNQNQLQMTTHYCAILTLSHQGAGCNCILSVSRRCVWCAARPPVLSLTQRHTAGWGGGDKNRFQKAGKPIEVETAGRGGDGWTACTVYWECIEPPPPNPPLEWVQEMVLQGCQAEIPAKKLKRGHKKKFLAEFWLILPKTGRKGAAENLYIVY